MSNAIRRSTPMTVEEFQDWVPPTGLEGRRWHLVNGEPVCMAPAGIDHGAIQGEAFFLIRQHLGSVGSPCRAVIAPGVIPRAGATTNELVPDLGVTCAPWGPDKTMAQPVVLVEVISPSNKVQTERNILAYTTIPSVQEILSLESLSITGKLYRRDRLGEWEDDPVALAGNDLVRLASIGFEARLTAFYLTSSLAPRL